MRCRARAAVSMPSCTFRSRHRFKYLQMVVSPTKLVLLPGLDGTGQFFSRLEAVLDNRVPLQVVKYPTDAMMSLDDYCAYAEAAIGGGSAVLLGESFSGPIAVKLAAKIPGEVKGLILVATYLKNPWPRWMIRRAAHTSPTAVPRGWIDAVLSGPDEDRALAAQIAGVMAGFSDELRSARLELVATTDVRAVFQRLACPILALHGRSDWLVPRFALQRALKPMPGARMKVLSGPHMLLQKSAAEAGQVIEAFFNSIEGSL